jgi:hypothetical protein
VPAKIVKKKGTGRKKIQEWTERQIEYR